MNFIACSRPSKTITDMNLFRLWEKSVRIASEFENVVAIFFPFAVASLFWFTCAYMYKTDRRESKWEAWKAKKKVFLVWYFSSNCLNAICMKYIQLFKKQTENWRWWGIFFLSLFRLLMQFFIILHSSSKKKNVPFGILKLFSKIATRKTRKH